MDADISHGIKDGWLIKVGIFNAAWRKRYFVLQGGALLGRIDYYKKEQKVWKGAITLSKVEEAQPLNTIDDLNRLTEQISRNSSDAVLAIPNVKEFPKDHYFFVIKTSSRLWVLGAKTLEERTQWISAINDVARRVNSPERSDGICSTPTKQPRAWSMGSVQKARSSQVLQAAPSAGIGRREIHSTSFVSVEGLPDYMRTDPEGDKARLAALNDIFKEFVDKEKALKRASGCSVIPLGRLCSMDSTRPDEFWKSLEASRVYGAWGEQLYAYAQRLIAARCEMPCDSGLPVVVFLDKVPRSNDKSVREEDTLDTPLSSSSSLSSSSVVVKSGNDNDDGGDNDNGNDDGKEEMTECVRDVRYILIVLSEALEKTISACDRKKLISGKYGAEPISLEKATELCGNIHNASVSLLRSLASMECVDALATGTHSRLGAESPLRVLTPDLTKLIAQWTLPGLAPRDDKKAAVMVTERSALAQLGAERAFLSKHIKRILSAGPVRFGFLNVRFPVEDANNFAKMAGKVPDCAYDGELPEGRLYCELSDEALCFTTSAKGDEVVIPLLWIRKLEVESSGGCFMKFTRYLEKPNAESNMETRIIYGDNTAETFAWLGDITRMFILRKQEK